MTNYELYRGRCKELCLEAIEVDSTLTLVRGYYYCPIWNTEEQHWWTTKSDGTIFDPSCNQFPSAGLGTYKEFDGTVECSNCGKVVLESEARFDGRYAFCCAICYGKFVGVL